MGKKKFIYFLVLLFIFLILGISISYDKIYIILFFILFLFLCFLLQFNYLAYLFLILGMLLCDRQFSYLKIPNTFIYITEATIIITLGLICFNIFISQNNKSINIPIKKFLIPYIFFGIISLFRGRNYGLDALRDFVIVYYFSIFIITLFYLKDKKSLDRIIFVFLIGCLITTINYLGIRLFNFNSYLNPIGAAHSMYLGMSIIFLFATLPLFKYKIFILGIIILQFIDTILFQVRSAWVSILVSFIIILYLMLKYRMLRIEHKKFLCLMILIFIICVVIYQLNIPSYNRTLEEFISIYNFQENKTISQANAMFRLKMWRDLICETFSGLDKILFGTPMGKPYFPESASHMETYLTGFGMDPHNSHLGVLYRMGIFGFLFYILVIFKTLYIGFSFLKNKTEESLKYRLYLLGFIGMFIVVLINSCFSVILEGPFGGIFFWITLGCIYGTIFLLLREHYYNTRKFEV